MLNPLYEPNNRVIWPSVAPMSLVIVLIIVTKCHKYLFISLICNQLASLVVSVTACHQSAPGSDPTASNI